MPLTIPPRLATVTDASHSLVRLRCGGSTNSGLIGRSTRRGTLLEVLLGGGGWTLTAQAANESGLAEKRPAMAMRKRYRVMAFAALVAALVAPVGLALSLGAVPSIAPTLHPVAAPFVTVAVMAPVVVPIRDAASASVIQQAFDAAGLLMVGTMLFGLAAVVRKAI